MRHDSRPIALFGPWPPPTGGVASHVQALRADLIGRGWEVAVMAHSADPHAPGVTTTDVRSATAVYRQIRAVCVPGGTIHGHGVMGFVPAKVQLAFLAAVRACRLRWVETVHDGTLPERFPQWPRLARWRYAAVLRRADHAFAVDERLATFLQDVGLSHGRISTVGPLLPSLVATSDAALEPDMAEFVEGHSPVLVAVGASHPTYDFLTMAGAFTRLHARLPAAGLVFLASSFADDPDYSERVRRRLQGSEGAVMYATDVDHRQVRALFRAAAVVLRGPARESYGLSRVEAMMQGTPVIGTPTGEHRFCRPYEHGDEESLLGAIEASLGGPAVDLRAAQRHYVELARSNLELIESVYR